MCWHAYVADVFRIPIAIHNKSSTVLQSCMLRTCSKKHATRQHTQQHHLMAQVSACHKRSKIGAIMKRKLARDPLHAPHTHDSTLIKVMMANGQQLQPMHICAFLPPFLSCIVYIGVSSLLSSPGGLWRQVRPV